MTYTRLYTFLCKRALLPETAFGLLSLIVALTLDPRSRIGTSAYLTRLGILEPIILGCLAGALYLFIRGHTSAFYLFFATLPMGIYSVYSLALVVDSDPTQPKMALIWFGIALLAWQVIWRKRRRDGFSFRFR